MLKDVTLRKGIHRAGEVSQVVKCLVSKCEALSSNPSTTKKKKEKVSLIET
jgi:hypothetical protein